MRPLAPARRPGRAHTPGPALTVAIALAFTAGPAAAADDSDTPAGGHPYAPTVAPASPDATKAIAGFRTAAGLKVELWAAEPLLANPVAFGFDEKGRAFVVETFRLHNGVTDTRGHMNWLDDDLASRTIADRVAKYRKFLGKDFDSYSKEHDRLRLVEDRDGDGKADHATVFVDGFHNTPDGLAAGVLARKGDVYFACIPDLWLLRDNNDDGKADAKTSLGYGYGVHTGFLGHDLHGLRFGPDGRLYFSIGDRGLNVTARDGRKLFLPDTGAVLRCEPDGSNLEFFATGLRNPQELAFDEFGNLFTVDNNSDGGDRARLVYIMEGSDSGWTMGWQYLEKPVSRGPWNDEKLWLPAFKGQAAHITPPLANLSDGPSGLAYHPGVARLPDRYKGHFFLADFRGSAGQSGVRSFTVKPKGAAFALDQSEQPLWGLEATDVDFGPDGALYVSDWVEGWNTTGKGRIYRLFDPAVSAAPSREVQQLIATGFDARPTAELVGLLSHADQRVRQEAQFALAAKGPEAVPPLAGTAAKGSLLARLHAVWALGQVARKGPTPAALEPLLALLDDSDPEVRAQAARTLGDARHAPAAPGVARLVASDASPRVRSLAAIAAGRIGRPDAVAGLLDVLRTANDQDPHLRHAAVMGLVGIHDREALLRAASDPSAAVRLGVLLAWRRLGNPEVARFLTSAEPRLVTEAARAIYDAPIDAALPDLATLAATDRKDLETPAARRALAAAARAGRPEGARALAGVAAKKGVAAALRTEALELLAEWPSPSGRDPVTGLWRPRAARPAAEAAEALAASFPSLLDDPNRSIRLAAVKAAGVLPIPGAGPKLAALMADPKQPAAARTEALRALDTSHDPALADAAAKAAESDSPTLRTEGRRLLARLRPAEALPLLTRVLESGTTVEKQGAFAALGDLPAGVSDPTIAAWLDRLAADKVAPEAALDLLDAAARRSDPAVAAKLRAYESTRPKDDPLAPYREALVGGDPARGRKILTEKAEVQCVRCHKVRGRGGEVGPELAGVAKRGDRRYLLESIVAPNRQIAQGFETVVVATTDGQVKTGVLKQETPTELRLVTAEGQPLTVLKTDIEERRRGASAMPDDLTKHLTRAEIRDLIAYLATLTTAP